MENIIYEANLGAIRKTSTNSIQYINSPNSTLINMINSKNADTNRTITKIEKYDEDIKLLKDSLIKYALQASVDSLDLKLKLELEEKCDISYLEKTLNTLRKSLKSQADEINIFKRVSEKLIKETIPEMERIIKENKEDVNDVINLTNNFKFNLENLTRDLGQCTNTSEFRILEESVTKYF